MQTNQQRVRERYRDKYTRTDGSHVSRKKHGKETKAGSTKRNVMLAEAFNITRKK